MRSCCSFRVESGKKSSKWKISKTSHSEVGSGSEVAMDSFDDLIYFPDVVKLYTSTKETLGKIDGTLRLNDDKIIAANLG